MFRLDCYFITDKGLVRQKNEDNYFLDGLCAQNGTENGLTCKGRGLFAVSDGMGGEKLGEKASAIAVQALGYYKDCNFNEYASDYVQYANTEVVNMAQENGVRSGATVAALYIEDDYAFCCNVGDSRIYFVRGDDLYLLTEDHTKAAQMVRLGVLTEQEAENHKDSHVLLQHLGISTDDFMIEPFETEFSIQKGDVFLLCSDGLTDMLGDEQIMSALKNGKTAKERAKTLLELALESGGKDNVTIGVVVCDKKMHRLFRRG